MEEGAAVVEFHGFKSNSNRFIVKELAIVGKSFQLQIVFKPPYSKDRLSEKMQKTAQWLTLYFHYITWEEGDVRFSKNLIRSLCKPFGVLYTKGREKAEFLRQFHSNVLEIDERLKVNDAGVVIVDCILDKHKKIKVKDALFVQQYHMLRRYYSPPPMAATAAAIAKLKRRKNLVH